MQDENKTAESAEKTGCCGGHGGGDKKEGCCKMKGCCMKLLMGGLVGGVVMFVYYLAAWKFLPWHHKDILSLAHENFSIGGMHLSFGNSHASNIRFFLLCFTGAALLTSVLKKGGCPVFKSMVIGLLVAGYSHLPDVIFAHLPVKNALAGMFNDFVAFALAGFAVSILVLKTGGCKMGHSCGGKGGEKAGCCGGEGKDGDKKGCCH